MASKTSNTYPQWMPRAQYRIGSIVWWRGNLMVAARARPGGTKSSFIWRRFDADTVARVRAREHHQARTLTPVASRGRAELCEIENIARQKAELTITDDDMKSLFGDSKDHPKIQMARVQAILRQIIIELKTGTNVGGDLRRALEKRVAELEGMVAKLKSLRGGSLHRVDLQPAAHMASMPYCVRRLHATGEDE